ncbi:unnamed protein product [Polarella glacialis]|uniref:Uncharacterized protein n=1 Tax=Polarella glacialis TaxID=89957 RepID=A0A813DNT4_POLGL|nr:unnamed protein product [Polarella glacialis]
MDVWLSGSEQRMQLLKTVPKAGSSTFFGWEGTSVRMEIGSRRHTPRLGGSDIMEYIAVETETISFTIQASHAGTEFPEDFEKQLKYSHLDWVALDMRREESYTGILPELWGTLPMTEKVAAMLTPPSQKAGFQVCGEECE